MALGALLVLGVIATYVRPTRFSFTHGTSHEAGMHPDVNRGLNTTRTSEAGALADKIDRTIQDDIAELCTRLVCEWRNAKDSHPIFEGSEEYPHFTAVSITLLRVESVAVLAGRLQELFHKDTEAQGRILDLLSDAHSDPVIREFLIYVVSPFSGKPGFEDVEKQLLLLARNQDQPDLRFAAVSSLWQMYFCGSRVVETGEIIPLQKCRKEQKRLLKASVLSALVELGGDLSLEPRHRFQARQGLVHSEVPILCRLATALGVLEFGDELNYGDILWTWDNGSYATDSWVYPDTFLRDEFGLDLEDSDALRVATTKAVQSQDLEQRRMALSSIIHTVEKKSLGPDFQNIVTAINANIQASDPVLLLTAFEGLARLRDSEASLRALRGTLARTDLPMDVHCAAMCLLSDVPGDDLGEFFSDVEYNGATRGISETAARIRKYRAIMVLPPSTWRR